MFSLFCRIIVLHDIALYHIAWYGIAPYGIARYCMTLHCIVWYDIALNCMISVLHGMVWYFIVLHGFAMPLLTTLVIFVYSSILFDNMFV